MQHDKTGMVIVVWFLSLTWLTQANTLAQAPGEGDRTQQAREQLLHAYQQTQTYQAQVTITISQKAGRLRQSMEYVIAFDRANNRLRVDRPDTLLVSDGSKLFFKADQVPGRHLEMTAPTRLDYDGLQAIGPVLGGIDSPDLVLLLATDPWAALGDDGPVMFSLDMPAASTADAMKVLRLKLADGRTWSLHIDATTQLLSKAVLTMDGTATGQPGTGVVELTFTYKIDKHNQPMDEALFAFDAKGSQSFGALQTMVQGGGGSGAQGHATLNKPMPTVTLTTLDGKPVDLSKETARVVILDFWASWCGPCRVGLPLLQEVQDWAKSENKPVVVYAVNVQENNDTIRQFVDQNQLTLPVLKDEQGAAARAFGVGGIPHTTVIVDGVVKAVHVGIPGNEAAQKAYVEKTKGEIRGWLEPAPASAKP